MVVESLSFALAGFVAWPTGAVELNGPEDLFEPPPPLPPAACFLELAAFGDDFGDLISDLLVVCELLLHGVCVAYA